MRVAESGLAGAALGSRDIQPRDSIVYRRTQICMATVDGRNWDDYWLWMESGWQAGSKKSRIFSILSVAALKVNPRVLFFYSYYIRLIKECSIIVSVIGNRVSSRGYKLSTNNKY